VHAKAKKKEIRKENHKIEKEKKERIESIFQQRKTKRSRKN
jgi:hypothetical protein